MVCLSSNVGSNTSSWFLSWFNYINAISGQCKSNKRETERDRLRERDIEKAREE